MVARMRIAISMLVVAACGPGPKTMHEPVGDDDDQPKVDAPSTPMIDGDFTPVVDGSCGSQTQQIGVVNLGDPPDLLVVLDRSGSMDEPPATFPPQFTSKWTIMRNALHTVVSAKQSAIKFGLLEFPSDGNCSADATAEVNVGLNSLGGFDTYFTSHSPNGNTPAHIGLNAALTYYSGIPVNTAGRYVLFATDGLPNCSGGDPNTRSDAETVAAVTALYNSGIHTYVLGFGSFSDPTVLNDAATAGGEARSGTTKYYEASNAMQLDAALQAIAGGIIVPSCSYHLQSPPPDPNNVTVTINGTPVPRSTQHTMGWDYHPDASTITFFGSYCDQIMSGAITDVSFAYGCPGPIIN
jgi:hypothetical protein